MNELEQLRAKVAAVEALADGWDNWDRYAQKNFGERTEGPAYARALRVALAMTDDLSADPGRCDYYSMDPEVTRHPRDDGWRCGLTEGHAERHVLYRANGESIQWTNGEWAQGVQS